MQSFIDYWISLLGIESLCSTLFKRFILIQNRFLHVILVQRVECCHLSVATCDVAHQATLAKPLSGMAFYNSNKVLLHVETLIFWDWITELLRFEYLLLIGIPANEHLIVNF